jgi:exodeoxyribonuclease VII large subunit
MATGMLQSMKSTTHRLGAAERALRTVSPLATLDRGYAIVTDASGRVLVDSSKTSKGAQIQARLAKGSIAAVVRGINSADKGESRD